VRHTPTNVVVRHPDLGRVGAAARLVIVWPFKQSPSPSGTLQFYRVASKWHGGRSDTVPPFREKVSHIDLPAHHAGSGDFTGTRCRVSGARIGRIRRAPLSGRPDTDVQAPLPECATKIFLPRKIAMVVVASRFVSGSIWDNRSLPDSQSQMDPIEQACMIRICIPTRSARAGTAFSQIRVSPFQTSIPLLRAHPQTRALAHPAASSKLTVIPAIFAVVPRRPTRALPSRRVQAPCRYADPHQFPSRSFEPHFESGALTSPASRTSRHWPFCGQ